MPVDPRKRKEERKEQGYSDEDLPDWIDEECKCNGAVVGWEHFESARKGTPGLMVRFVALDGPQAGRITSRNFWKTENALYMLADLALGLGWEEPFDEDSDDDLERVFGNGAVKMTVKAQDPYEKSDGTWVTPHEPAFFRPTRYKITKKDKPLIDAGEASMRAYFAWRENNPRGSGGGGGSSSSGSGYSGGSGGGGGDSYSAPDEEIPF